MRHPTRPWLALLISVLAHVAVALVLAGPASRMVRHDGAGAGAWAGGAAFGACAWATGNTVHAMAPPTTTAKATAGRSGKKGSLFPIVMQSQIRAISPYRNLRRNSALPPTVR